MSDLAGTSNFEKANVKYPSLISNTDRAGPTATHSWNILDIHLALRILMNLLK